MTNGKSESIGIRVPAELMTELESVGNGTPHYRKKRKNRRDTRNYDLTRLLLDAIRAGLSVIKSGEYVPVSEVTLKQELDDVKQKLQVLFNKVSNLEDKGLSNNTPDEKANKCPIANLEEIIQEKDRAIEELETIKAYTKQQEELVNKYYDQMNYWKTKAEKKWDVINNYEIEKQKTVQLQAQTETLREQLAAAQAKVARLSSSPPTPVIIDTLAISISTL